MVKAKPTLPDRASRKRYRFEKQLKTHHLHLLKLASFSPSPSQTPQPPPKESPTKPTNSTQETTTEKSHKTPSSLSTRTLRRRIKFKKQSRSLSYNASKSLSISPSVSCSSSSSPSISLSPLTFTLSPVAKTAISPETSPFPPFPPKPSPDFLRRSVSDPSKLLTHRSADNSVTPMKSPSRPVSRNLMGQLTPLPASSPWSALRRAISDPVHLNCSSSKEENEMGKMKYKGVEAERLSGEWIVVKFNCECGKDAHYLVNANDKKYFKLV